MAPTLINTAYLGERIEDVEEELFILYTRRAGFKDESGDALDSIVLSGSNRSALGLVDQRNDSVDLQFSHSVENNAPTNHKKRKIVSKPLVKKLEVSLAQNITALRSRVGDTGGGVWRGSILLAQALLQQLHSVVSQDTLLEKQALSTARVLELGSGTGLLGLILAPFTGHHTCTDLPELVPLMKKNILLNTKLLSDCPGRLSYEALNWNDVHECSPAARERVFLKRTSASHMGVDINAQEGSAGFDLVLAVDCVYNPSLIPPLLTTIDLYSIPGRTAVLVVMELRDEDVLREFLTQWIGMPGWEVWSIGNEAHPTLLDERFAMWIGFKVTKLSD